MSILRQATPTLLFFALCSCSSSQNPGYATNESDVTPASREPAADPATYNGQAAYRIVNYNAPDPNFNVNEDLTVMSPQEKESLDAVAMVSGVISASGGSLLKVNGKDDTVPNGESPSALKQIIANLKRLTSQIKPYLGVIRPIHQVVFFVPMDPDSRDLHHGIDKLSTEPGLQNTQWAKQSVDTTVLNPLSPEFTSEVDRGIKNKLAEFTAAVKAKTAQPAQVLGFRTSVFYDPKIQRGSIAVEALIALRSGEMPLNVKLGTAGALSSYSIPFDGQGRVTVAVLAASVGLNQSVEDWGELDLRFGEYASFLGYTFLLRGEPNLILGTNQVPGLAPPPAKFDNAFIPRVNIALAGKPDAKAYLGHVKIDLKKMQIRDLDASVGLRWLPSISLDRIQNNSIKSINVVDQVNAKIDAQVQNALNGGMDDVINKILGGGAK